MAKRRDIKPVVMKCPHCGGRMVYPKTRYHKCGKKKKSNYKQSFEK